MSEEAVERPKAKSATAITALVLSIIALALSLVPIVNNFAFVLAIVALIFGIVGIVGISRGERSGLGMAVAAISIAAVAAIAVLVSQAVYSSEIDKMTGGATEEIIASDVDIAFGSYTLKKNNGVITSKLPVRVTNLTDKNASYAIQIEATDSAGDRIADDTIYLNDLAPNQGQTVRAFVHVPIEDYQAMRTARFTIVSVSEY